jgi:transcriptional regulator NrdR family protein
MTCPTCNKQMKKLADSKDTHGLPATPDWTDYHCETCNQKWRHDREKSAMMRV